MYYPSKKRKEKKKQETLRAEFLAHMRTVDPQATKDYSKPRSLMEFALLDLKMAQ